MTRPTPKTLQFRLFVRDGWHCCYCGRAVFFSPTLKLLDQMSPGHGYYDRNGKHGVMLKVLEESVACCDRVLAYTKGGETTEENLRTACFACNRRKSDSELPAEAGLAVPARTEGWDGFASLYPRLPGADPAWCRVIERELGR